METEIKTITNNLARDIALIKQAILSEGELTLKARKELAAARSRHEKYYPLNEVKRLILAK